MRKPVNRGTKSNPRYSGPVRYRGKQRWVPGVYPSLRAWEDAARETVARLKAELDAEAPGHEVTVEEYANDIWLKLNPRPKEISNDRLRESIRPFVARYGSRRFDEISRLPARKWMADQTTATDRPSGPSSGKKARMPSGKNHCRATWPCGCSHSSRVAMACWV